jgi:putative restriction endonuclease
MPATTPREIVQSILDAIAVSGHSAIIVSSERQHPRKFVVSVPDGTQMSLWVYAWTLTHGGRPSLPREYRIQMTTVVDPLAINPLGPTVLIGYEPNLRVFAGFDITRHSTFTAGSPSVQVNIDVLHAALQQGLAFDRKSNDEIAVGIRPDRLMAYIYNAMDLHTYGRQTATFRLFAKASALEPIPAEEIDPLPTERKRVVQTVSRLSRQANFQQQVLQAYGQRCAVNRMQLRLVDAAHILPVGGPGSADDVRNGIALSPTYHRAYDTGIIFLDDKYIMRINPAKASALTQMKLDGGLSEFKASLGKIHLPPDQRQWPLCSFIQKANRYRQIIVT